MANVKSPCIKLCKLDPSTKMCIGCKRYEGEIKLWLSMSNEDRQATIDLLPQRKLSPSLKNHG
jgi:predicted Fe-S protein YdhL (DUF1289 family)